ncbi:MAG: phospho-sugar mutase [Firmicutes bacterium]|nr:phospho-sugar mutase [Bacillota bacterium]
MEKALKQYTRWLSESLPADLRAELENIKDCEEEIHDRFCRDMTFGTSGLRGRMGVGTCWMNSVVLKRATMGIADYVLKRRPHPAMAISYDTRLNSREYAYGVADVLAARGIDVWIMSEAQPVPLLSFAVRYLGLSGGIMITASHNPKDYNGYKVYDHFGNQIDDAKARLMETYIAQHGYFEEPRLTPGVSGKIFPVPQETIDAYRSEISKLAVRPGHVTEPADVEILYTPLNGTGIKHVPEILGRAGLEKLQLVECQLEGDGLFATCPSPNPENPQAFHEALKLAADRIAEGKAPADLIIATDPDCDRMGAMVYHGGEYVLLSGNQMGELMFDYLCICHGGREKKGLEGKIVYKSLVSSPLVDLMAAPHGIQVGNTLTGFKNIALQMEKLAEEGREKDFLFGFEESIGYLYGMYTRDKDGVLASQLAYLTAAYWKAEGISLVDRLNQIHDQYGFVETRAASVHFRREKDREVISGIMDALLSGELCRILDCPVEADLAYKNENIFQGVIKNKDSGGRSCSHRFIVRPSGTELKLKSYVFAEGSCQSDAEEAADGLLKELQTWLNEKKEEII